jgi:type I restriction-modification system DNA methylase subunit
MRKAKYKQAQQDFPLNEVPRGSRICDPTCGSASLLIKAGQEVGSKNFSLYGQEANGSTWALAVINMFLHGFDDATIRWGDTIRNPKLKEGDALMKFDTVVANSPFSLVFERINGLTYENSIRIGFTY